MTRKGGGGKSSEKQWNKPQESTKENKGLRENVHCGPCIGLRKLQFLEGQARN